MPANVLTEWARVLLVSLADAGVEDVVVSPGSRSTPFIVAAAAEPRLRCHQVIDERAAGFFALGQARATGRPSVLLCTSGTAAAHYYPAVVEASLAYLPLLVLTADRPIELQDCGAAQTIDQVKLYGGHVRRFYELGNPDPAAAALGGLRRLATQAVHASRWPEPGPVHLNARARKPLEPRQPTDPAGHELRAAADRVLARPVTSAPRPQAIPDAAAVGSVAERLRSTERGVIVAGPAPGGAGRWQDDVVELARRLQYPLLAESTSQLRFAGTSPEQLRCDAFDLLLGVSPFVARHRPEVSIQLGGTPTSGAWERLRSATGRRGPTAEGDDDLFEVVITDHGWPDSSTTADVILRGDRPKVVTGLLAALGDGWTRPPSSYLAAWTKAGDVAAEVTAELLGDAARGLREGHVVVEVLRHIPSGSALMVGNSLPIRLLDLYGRSGAAQICMYSQRGANGIEGLVAGTCGTASATDRPVTLLLGDVSLLHDLNSLGLTARATVPVVVVVIQNRGGRLFEQLPIATTAELPAGTLDLVMTPHALSFEGAASMFGLGYRRADSVSALQEALAVAYDRPGGFLVEAIVPPHGAQEDLQALQSGLAQALS